MKIFFENLPPALKNELVVKTMDDILIKEKKKRPKTNDEWRNLWEKACKKIHKYNHDSMTRINKLFNL